MTGTFHDLRQTKEWSNYLQQIGWQVEEVSSQQSAVSSYLYIKKLPILPVSIAKLQRPVGKIDFDQVMRVAGKHRVILIYIEPRIMNHESGIRNQEEELSKRGFRKTKSAHLPKKTIWVDLRKSRQQLLAEMKSKTRYNIKLAKRRKINIRIYSGRKILKTNLLSLLQENSKRLKVFAMPKKWFMAQVDAFGSKCFATLAFYQDKLVAGNFFMTSPNACFYSHNGSTQLGRKLMAPTLCAWKGVLEAKRRKLKTFDFDGIWDGSRSLARWQGFSQFKKGFGGEEVEFVGQYKKFTFS